MAGSAVMRLPLALALACLVVAGCTSPPRPSPEPPPALPPEESRGFFADSRHCYAMNVLATVLAADVLVLTPRAWTLPNPVTAEVRILLHRCIEDSTTFVAVRMHAGPDRSYPMANFLLEILTNGTEDDWARMGAPVRQAATTWNRTASGGEEWTVSTEGGVALRITRSESLGPVRPYGRVEAYGGGPGLERSWAEETAILSRLVASSVTFGAASPLRDAHASPGDSTVAQWWGAFNAEYRTGLPP